MTESVAVERDYLYEELWKACAGPLVDVPKTGDRVFYFPQGHLEHLEVLMGQGFDEQISLFDVPSKILCRVMDRQLKAEADTDEVYVHITLLPESDQTDPLILEPCIPEPPRPTFYSFCKVLKASDTKTHGGFSILLNHAIDCLPPLDMQQQIPTQELVTTDLHGRNWTFKHIYRGQPKRHLLTAGWGTFLSSKKLLTGDSFIFLREEGGGMRVGVRHAQVQHIVHTPVVSSQSMHLGVLATASHAIAASTFFTIYYKPRISQFVVGVNKYLQAVRNEYTTGTKFRMRFEEEDVPNSFVGTIVGTGDISPRWPGSKWRSLEVKWDVVTTTRRPLRVSPWEIELIRPTRSRSFPLPTMDKNKRPRQPTYVANNLAHEPTTEALQQYPSTSLWPATHREKDVFNSQFDVGSSSMTKHASPEQSQDDNRDVVTHMPPSQETDTVPSQDTCAVTKATSSASTSENERDEKQPESSGGSCPFRLFGVDFSSKYG